MTTLDVYQGATPKLTKISLETHKSPEGQKVSTEARNQLKTISNKEFLKFSQDERLEYISDKKSSEIKQNDEIIFNFTFDNKINKDLWLNTTAWQVLPKQVREVKIWEQIFTRWDTLLWEFFDKNNSRLIINDKTKIIVSKIWNTKELEEKNNSKKVEFYKKYPDYVYLVSLAIDKDIDPDFAVFVFWDKIKDIDPLNLSRKSDIEDMLTEFDRIRWWLDSFSFENDKYPDELVVRLLKKFNQDTYKYKSIEYWIKEEEIKKYENLNTAKYLNISDKQEIIEQAPTELRDQVKIYFPPEEYENALITSYFESSFKKEATNINTDKYSSVDNWYFQINEHYHQNKYIWEDIFNPETNVRVAYEIFKEAWNKWIPWYGAQKAWLW